MRGYCLCIGKDKVEWEAFFCVQQNVNLIFELTSLSFAISVPVQDDTSKFEHVCTATKEPSHSEFQGH